MRRPGILNGIQGMIPKTRYQSKKTSYLGSFGKAVILPPPEPPPGIPPGSSPPQYIEGKWQCSGAQPPSEADGYYHCCPVTGWTKTAFENKKPCGENHGLIKCGPLSNGGTTQDSICCENMQQWVLKDPAGGDPCKQAALLQSQIPGRAIPGVTETILTEDVIEYKQPLVNPTFLLIGGFAAIILVIIAVIKLS